MNNLDWDDEVQDSDNPCPRCGHYNTSYRKCEYCDDGINDDLYEEDPLWYDPDDWEYCQHCHGKGYYNWCRNCGWDLVEQCFINQSNLPVKEFALRHPFSFILLQSRPVAFSLFHNLKEKEMDEGTVARVLVDSTQDLGHSAQTISGEISRSVEIMQDVAQGIREAEAALLIPLSAASVSPSRVLKPYVDPSRKKRCDEQERQARKLTNREKRKVADQRRKTRRK